MSTSILNIRNSVPFALRCIAILAALLFSNAAMSDEAILAPGYGKLAYPAPIAGTYDLPIIRQAGDGQVLDSNGEPHRLLDLMNDKVVLLSFIYSTCSDVNGCPLATLVFHRIKQYLQKHPELSQQLRLMTLSFDPVHDTPEQMQHYGAGFQDQSIDWLFLTTTSEQQIKPILDQYQQPVNKNYTEDGQFTGTYSHVLRVYLIDRNQQIRNIYSVSFLHPETLLSDVKTLLIEPDDKQTVVQNTDNKKRFLAGDNKTGYQSSDYQTQAQALTQRTGIEADLLGLAMNPPLGLPPLPIPANNPITNEKIALGRKLFYDRRLSLNQTFSCAMCHVPEQGFTSNEMKTAVGIEGRTVRRNSPTLYNVGYFSALFHDSRESTLEQQVWGPLLAVNEMGNPSIAAVLDAINQDPDYVRQFQQIFNRPPGMETVGMALASYQRSLNSANSAFDRWYYGKQESALTGQQKRGWRLFSGKAGCSACHQVGQNNALFTDQQNHNTGVGYADSLPDTDKTQSVQVAPGVFIKVNQDIIRSVSEPTANDLGRYEITQNPAHRWQYKTPSLRNISLTAPYMHNGSLSTLEEVITFYNQGGIKNENLDPLIHLLSLNEQEQQDLVAFLHALTGDNVELLVSDAFAAPVNDPE